MKTIIVDSNKLYPLVLEGLDICHRHGAVNWTIWTNKDGGVEIQHESVDHTGWYEISFIAPWDNTFLYGVRPGDEGYEYSEAAWKIIDRLKKQVITVLDENENDMAVYIV